MTGKASWNTNCPCWLQRNSCGCQVTWILAVRFYQVLSRDGIMGSLLTMQVSRAPCPLSYAHSKLPQTPRSAMHTCARGDVWKASPRPRLRAQLSSVFRPASKTSRTHMLSLWLKYKTSQWFFFFWRWDNTASVLTESESNFFKPNYWSHLSVG